MGENLERKGLSANAFVYAATSETWRLAISSCVTQLDRSNSSYSSEQKPVRGGISLVCRSF
jgi:hypothetical protein